MVGSANAMDPRVKQVMLAEAPFALKRLSFSTTPAAKKDMPNTNSMLERIEPEQNTFNQEGMFLHAVHLTTTTSQPPNTHQYLSPSRFPGK